jgi:hypothetical protein
MFYHNHRRYKSGKRQGKAPIELLTGKPLEASWWELLRQQVNTEQGVTDSGTLPTRPPLHLVVNNDDQTNQPGMAPGQAIIAPTGAAEHDRRHEDSKAASSFHLCCHSAFVRALLEGPNWVYIQPYLRCNRANCQLLLAFREGGRFFQPDCVENICFDGFSRTGGLTKGWLYDTNVFQIANFLRVEHLELPVNNPDYVNPLGGTSQISFVIRRC